MRHAQSDVKLIKVLYFAGTHGDWGGASRVLFATLSQLDRTRFEPIVALPMDGPASNLLAEMGIDYVIWGAMAEYRSAVQYLSAVIRVLCWVRRRNIDIIHMNRANDWRPAEHVAARIAQIPIVTHFHTVNSDKAPATRMSAAIAAVSGFVGSHSDCLGVPVHVIHNSVDERKFATGKNIRAQLGLDDEKIVITFAGQIRRIKGVELFVSAAKRVSGENIRFLVVGDCRTGAGIDDAYSYDEFRDLIAGDDRITYAGYRMDMPDVYHSSDVVVVPSQWDEPFGLVLIEAGAASKPVVATSVGGIPEVVLDGKTGFLVPRGSVDELAYRMQLLASNSSLRVALGFGAKAWVASAFTESPVRKLEALYESLV